MKKMFLCLALGVSMCCYAQDAVQYAPAATQSESAGGWYFTYVTQGTSDNPISTCVIEKSEQKVPGTGAIKPYGTTNKDLLVPVSVERAHTGTGGDWTETIQIIGLGVDAFYNSKCSSVTFAEGSLVASIATGAFRSMSNMKGKLVLPASLTKLSVSSILLPNITEIEFLGTTPPTCEEVGDYNPWTSASNGATPATIKVTVPEGYKDAYTGNNAPGIGDYFDCLKGTATDVTELENAPAKACKVMRNGQLLIEKAGVLYTAEGKKLDN